MTRKGVSGARLAGLGNRLRRYLAKGEAPTTILLHLGTNDIFKENLGQIRHRVKECLEAIRNILPNTRLIWSDILLRAKYHGEVKGGAGKRCTWDLNMYARKILREMQNAHVIKHSHLINPSQEGVYWQDMIHLDTRGTLLFRQNLSDGLMFFNTYPDAFHFPLCDQV